MRILITGAQGFTGRHFVALAERYGHQAIPLAADVTNQPILKQEIDSIDFDAVVHLAALSFVGHADANEFYSVNTLGTTNLLDVLATSKKKPEVILLASSANVYGNARVSPIVEGASTQPNNHYAMSKLAMEIMASTYSERLPIVTVRPFNYTGPGQTPNFLIPKLVAHYANRSERVELGNLDVEREFNDVRMVCECYLKLLNPSFSGDTFNVCTGKAYSLRQVLDQLESLTGHVLEVDVNKKFVRQNEIKLLAGSPEKLERQIGKQGEWKLEDTLRWMLNSPSLKEC